MSNDGESAAMKAPREPGCYWARGNGSDPDWILVDVRPVDERGRQWIDVMGWDAGTSEDGIAEWGPRVLPPCGEPDAIEIGAFEAWVKENPDASLFSAYKHGLQSGAAPAKHCHPVPPMAAGKAPTPPCALEIEDIERCKSIARELRYIADNIEKASAERDWLGVATVQLNRAPMSVVEMAGRAAMRYSMTRGGR